MQTFVPSAALRDRVASINLFEDDGGRARVLPSTGAVLGFQIHGRVRTGTELLSPAGVTGIQGSARDYDYLGRTTSVLVRFTPQGASCLGVPVSELSDHSVALADLLPAGRASEASERLCDAGTVGEGIAVVEALLLGLGFVADPLVERALELLGAGSKPGEPVAAVARALGISERQLERRVLARVGVTPKRFASLRRFEHAAALARTRPSLTSVALEAGYYDQSHFIREFRRFAGMTPGEFSGRG
jgi:AraC-like DNA-binding protein